MNRIENPEQLDATMQQLQSEDVAERREAGRQLSYINRYQTIGFELAIPVILDKAANDSDVYVRERCVEAIRMAYSKIAISNTTLDAIVILALDQKADDSKGWVRERAQEFLLEIIHYDSDMRNIKKALDALINAAGGDKLTGEIVEKLGIYKTEKDTPHRVREMATQILNAKDAREVRTERLPARDVAGAAPKRAVARVG
ncbi:hypothetical protein J4450_05600 [Candidatus Micrarchaeota archaeon]|nr:hypothetical protein [Candidatus Micrarchaeota archaeon]